MTYAHKLFEDNAGNLHLAALDASGTCVYYLADSDRELVLNTLTDLTAGGDPIADGWEGGEDDPAACYAAIVETVDCRNGGARELDVARIREDRERGIVRDWDGYAQEIEAVDAWWNAQVSDRMPIYRIGGALYCATGWNGESYTESFRVVDRFTAADNETHDLRPIYRFQDEEREPDEDSDEDFEIVGFDVN